jgi:hypothetical protein
MMLPSGGMLSPGPVDAASGLPVETDL